MTIEKVKVTKEVAEALEEVARNQISTGLTLNFHAANCLSGKYAPLQTIAIEDLAKALIIGYEVEKPPEEKVREYYESLKLSEEYCEGSLRGTGGQHRQGWLSVVKTLDILGIKIEGVNA